MKEKWIQQWYDKAGLWHQDKTLSQEEAKRLYYKNYVSSPHVYFTDATIKNVINYIKTGSLLAALKILRTATGYSLIAAKGVANLYRIAYQAFGDQAFTNIKNPTSPMANSV